MSARKVDIVLSPEAQADFEDLVQVGQAEWGDDPADACATAIRAALERLARFPRIGHERPDLFPGARGSVVRRHLIVYRRQDANVEVVRILHVRMDAERWFAVRRQEHP